MLNHKRKSLKDKLQYVILLLKRGGLILKIAEIEAKIERGDCSAEILDLFKTALKRVPKVVAVSIATLLLPLCLLILISKQFL